MSASPLSVAVIPAFREPTVVGGVVESVRPYVDIVVVVDDGSGDRTAEAARVAGAVVLVHLVNRGQGAALATGIEYALRCGASEIVTVDADGQHDPSEIPSLLKPIRDGQVDVVLGSRFLQSTHLVPVPRRWILQMATWFTRLTTGLSVTDTHNGYRALSRKAASAIQLTQDRMAHASEILEQIREKRLRYIEVPVTIRYTDYSMAKGQSALAAARILMDLWVGKVLG